jgi:hypothetical protein
MWIGKSGVTFAVTKVRGFGGTNGFMALDLGEYVMRDEQEVGVHTAQFRSGRTARHQAHHRLFELG